MRAALVPESAAEFDRQWRAALARAAETYDLAVVDQCLDAWRRVARVTAVAGGADPYRAMRDAADARAGGTATSPVVSWREVRASLGPLGGR